jgi:hypothetical protein
MLLSETPELLICLIAAEKISRKNRGVFRAMRTTICSGAKRMRAPKNRRGDRNVGRVRGPAVRFLASAAIHSSQLAKAAWRRVRSTGGVLSKGNVTMAAPKQRS